jgi:hypothetical protein
MAILVRSRSYNYRLAIHIAKTVDDAFIELIRRLTPIGSEIDAKASAVFEHVYRMNA